MRARKVKRGNQIEMKSMKSSSSIFLATLCLFLFPFFRFHYTGKMDKKACSVKNVLQNPSLKKSPGSILLKKEFYLFNRLLTERLEAQSTRDEQKATYAGG